MNFIKSRTAYSGIIDPKNKRRKANDFQHTVYFLIDGAEIFQKEIAFCPFSLIINISTRKKKAFTTFFSMTWVTILRSYCESLLVHAVSVAFVPNLIKPNEHL